MLRNPILLFIIILTFNQRLTAQLPGVNLPVVYAPQETIYLSPNGSDLNTGAMNSPLKTFYAALTHISWGVVNVNGGNAYAEVVLLPGDYYPVGNAGFVQTVSEWRQNISSSWVYKNVSIRGAGNVRIHGDLLNSGVQMIFLMGDHIRVSNVQIDNCKLHGIYISGSEITHHTDAEVDSVSVDSVAGFGIFISGYDRVRVQHCTVNNTCRANANEVNNTCQWPSGLRADNCTHVIFNNNIISHNWGEGLNTSYCRHVDVRDNLVFDNYSVNIYCHSASLAIYRNNIIYNSDSAYWRYCYNSNGSGAFGITVANELSCTSGCFLYSNACGSTTSCCSYTDYDHAVSTDVSYFQTDSVFIFNNLLLEAGIDIWDAFSTAFSYAYMNHIFIEQNTVIGRAGSSAVTKSPLLLSLGTPYVYFANLRIRNNIFSVDDQLPNYSAFYGYAAAGICNGTWTNNISFADNLWHIVPANPGISFSSDLASANLPLHAVIGDTVNLKPSPVHPELVMNAPMINYISEDLYHHPRNATTNAGAVEYNTSNSVQTSTSNDETPVVYPVPADDHFTLKYGASGGQNEYCITNAAGQVATNWRPMHQSEVISTANWPDGIYFVVVRSNGKAQTIKVAVCR